MPAGSRRCRRCWQWPIRPDHRPDGTVRRVRCINYLNSFLSVVVTPLPAASANSLATKPISLTTPMGLFSNRPFLIVRNVSMPASAALAPASVRKPRIGRSRCFRQAWSLSIRLLRGFVRALGPECHKPPSQLSGGQFRDILGPTAKRVSPRVAVRSGGEAMAFWAEQGGDLFVR